MTAFLILFIIVTIVSASVLVPKWLDQRILKAEFPSPWTAIVNRRLPFVEKMARAEQDQLQAMMKLFLAKKRFHGCGGLEITEEIRVTIAAEACLLLLNRKSSLYGKLKHILVYPDAFKTGRQQFNKDGTVNHKEAGLLGESWSNGKVILSWDDVEHGVENFADGHNVVLHEFSHQLDTESGAANGAPLLKKNSYQAWASVLSTEYEILVQSMEDHHRTVMDYYGATNPAEFFAVATETFFEKPLQMAKKHPELFEELKVYYCVDPRSWLA